MALFTDQLTKYTFPLDFTPEVLDERLVNRLDKIFNKLLDNVGGVDNVIFAPPSTENLFYKTGKLYQPDFNEDGKVTGIEVAFVVKDINLVSDEYKSQVEVLESK